jgi:hypothetical protein
LGDFVALQAQPNAKRWRWHRRLRIGRIHWS